MVDDSFRIRRALHRGLFLAHLEEARPFPPGDRPAHTVVDGGPGRHVKLDAAFVPQGWLGEAMLCIALGWEEV
jgi:hypothetical protein